MAFPLNFIKLSGLKYKNLFLECLDFSKLINQLSDFRCEGVITLLSKPEKNKLSASNYRPITLLNCNSKIISKVIANRIGPFLNDFIEKIQSGFMKARNIEDNIRLLFIIIIDYANHK